MADTTKLNYVVDHFDKANMVLMVSFPDDGTSANIGIKSIPTTQEALDELVKPFATHQEVVDTLAAVKPVDLSFLNGRVGKKNSTTRFSVVDATKATQALLADTTATQATVTLASNEVQIGSTTGVAPEVAAAHDRDADKAYIKALIAEVLAEQKAS
jgi:hypothetical protein